MSKQRSLATAWLLPVAIAVVHASIAMAAPPDADEAREGDIRARDAYFASRHAGPSADFDAAAAREAAVQARNDALPSAMARIPRAYQHAEAWQPIGPAPLVGGQTPTFPFIPSPVSGRVSAIAIDDPDSVVFIGGAQGGVWRSDNGGTTWQPLSDNLTSLAIGTIVIAPGPHPRNQATLYVGTGEGNFSADSYAGTGVYKSTDSGRTWQGPLGFSSFHGRSVLTLAVDRTNANVVLAGSSSGVAGVSGLTPPGTLPTRGIYRSTDGGQTWTIATIPATGNAERVSKIVQDPNLATRFWAAMSTVATAEFGLLVSDDSGQTWTAVDDGVGAHPPHVNVNNTTALIGRTSISVMNNAGSTVLYFATAEVPASQAGAGNGGTLYVSTNANNASVAAIAFTAVPAADGFCEGQCWYDIPIAVDTTNADLVYTGGAGGSSTDDNTNTGVELTPSMFMRSNNGTSGATATFASHVRSIDQSGALHADVHAVVPWPGHANEIWVGNDGGVWKSTDAGDHWVNLNTTLQLTQFSGCDLDPVDPNRAYGGTQDNGTNGYAGTVGWPHLDFGDGGFALIDQGHPQNLVHTYYNQRNNLVGVGFTTSGFSTTQGLYFGSFADPGPLGNGIAITDRVLFYAPLHLDKGATDTLYYGANRLWKADAFFSQTVDGQGNGQPNIFHALGSGAGGQDLTGGTIGSAAGGALSAIETVANAAPGLDAQIIFTGSNNGHVFRSIDGGVSFTEVDATPTVIGQYVSDIAVDPRNAQIVFQGRAGFTGAVPYHNVRKSTDGGATWTDASNGMPDIPVNAIAFDPVAPNTLWAGTDIGVYLSSDGGATWNPYANGMPNVAVIDLKTNSANQTILACTHGRGAFRLTLDAIFIDGFDGN